MNEEYARWRHSKCNCPGCSRSRDMAWEIQGLTERAHGLENRLNAAHYQLVQLYLVGWRQGWEEGLTEQEIREAVGDYLANVDLDPTNDMEAVHRLLKAKPRP